MRSDLFLEFARKVRRSPLDIPERVVALDPGETTGWAYFELGKMKDCGQLKEGVVAKQGRKIIEMIDELQPTVIVVEDYRIYAGKLKQHTWSNLYTPRLVGIIEILAEMHHIPLVMQMASMKSFCTNEKLKSWGLYRPGIPHAMDAVSHACHYILFGK